MTTDAIRDARTVTRDETARCIADPARAEFMRRLTEHEDVLADLLNRQTPELVERFRMSCRSVVAAYDRACLKTLGGEATSA